MVMENEAKGVEVVVSGKLRGQRAKAMKFCDGYMKKSGYSPKGNTSHMSYSFLKTSQDYVLSLPLFSAFVLVSFVP